MAEETAAGAFGGAAQGAAAGAAVGGPWGAVIGAVIGGALGAFSGDARRKQRRYTRLAAETRRRQQTMQLAIQRRDTVRQFRMARAQAVAAGESEGNVGSSAIMGAVSSLSAQGNSNLDYFDNQVSLDNLYQMYAKKAGKAAEQAGTLDAILGASGSVAQIGTNLNGFYAAQGVGDAYAPKSVSGYSTLSQPTQQGSSVVTIPYAFPQVNVLGSSP